MVNGACLCGAVRFRVEADLRDPIACHCKQCRQVSGHFFSAVPAPTAAVRGGVVLVDLGVGPPARAGGVSPLSLTLDKTSARSSRAFFVPGVRVGGRASSTSSSAPLWRMKSMASRVAGERGGAAPARVPTQTRPRVGWEASVEEMSLLLFCGLS